MDQRQERRADLLADVALGVGLAREDDAVAVGDGQRAALREVALAQPGAEPGEIDAADHHRGDLAGLADRQRHRQMGRLVRPRAGVAADDEGARRHRLGEPGRRRRPPRPRN